MWVNPEGKSAYQFFYNISPLRCSVQKFRAWRDKLSDRRLGIDTISSPKTLSFADKWFDDNSKYETLHYPLLERYLIPLELSPYDVVFDIGCGLGRMVCFIARMKVMKCVGIELAIELSAEAKANAKGLRGK